MRAEASRLGSSPRSQTHHEASGRARPEVTGTQKCKYGESGPANTRCIESAAWGVQKPLALTIVQTSKKVDGRNRIPLFAALITQGSSQGPGYDTLRQGGEWPRVQTPA